MKIKIMNPFKNLKSFSGIITIAILSGIVGSILIMSFLIWQEIKIFNSIKITSTQNLEITEAEDKSKEEIVDTDKETTHINEKLGFSFSYSKGLDLSEWGDNSVSLFAHLPWPQRGVNLNFREVGKTLEECIDEYNKSDVLEDGSALATIFNQEDYVIGGKKAILLEGSTAIGGTRNIIFVINNGRSYTITFWEGVIDEELEILESFKFLEDDTAGLYRPAILNNKYEYNGVEVYYEYKEGSKLGYNLFIKKDGKESILADDILFDAPGGSVPEFYETKDPSLVLLRASLADMGGFAHQYYYIDLNLGTYLKIVETQSSLSINHYQLGLDIEDNCPIRQGTVEYEGDIAFLTGISGKIVSDYIYNSKIELTCVDPGGIGVLYDPNPQIKFVGVNPSREKIYFEVLGNIFTLNIGEGLITEEELTDLL